jgi:hypothetical protein
MNRCIGYTKTGKKCRAPLKGDRKYFCCESHKPYNKEIVEEEGCCICSENDFKKGELRMYRCGHAVHKECYQEWLKFSTYKEPVCMVCREPIEKKLEKKINEEYDINEKGVKIKKYPSTVEENKYFYFIQSLILDKKKNEFKSFSFPEKDLTDKI